jgi:hypothetical protein
MATTTPNFGWVVPTSSDLVKNGAVAIETLGDSIDASMVDLKGGTTGQVLTKATNTDMDFTWAAATSPMPTYSAYAATNQSISTSTWTKITFGTEEWDTNSNFASSRFTPTVAGYYTIAGRVDLSGLVAATTAYLALYKNGANYKTLASFTYSFNSIGFGGGTTVYMNGSTDYIELYAFVNAGVPVITGGSGITDATWFNGVGVRA